MRSPLLRTLLLLAILSCASSTFAQSFYVGLTTGEIVKVAPDGSSTHFGTTNIPEGMAVDQTGNLFVADSSDNVIYKFSPSGSRTLFVSGLSGVSDIALDSAGLVYGADTNNNRIVRFTPGGSSLGVYGTGVSSPEALTFDDDDNLFVASSGNNQIVQYPPGGGSSPTVFGTTTPSVVTLTFDSDFTHLYEGGSGSGVIMSFDRAGTPSTYPKAVEAADMTFDLDGIFYVLDTNNNKILKFTPDTTQTTFATLSGKPTGFVFILPPRDQVSGSGTIATMSGTGTFNFKVTRSKNGKVSGRLTYADGTVSLKGGKPSVMNILGEDAEFRGTAKLGKNNRVSFVVDINDFAMPGTADTFAIRLSNGYSASGDLTSGDIQILKK